MPPTPASVSARRCCSPTAKPSPVSNVENVSYGLTLCAERSALVRAVSKFGPEIRIEAVAVANLNDAPSPPCGACRQVLAEFILPDAPVIFPTADGARTLPFRELLPLVFEMKEK